MFYMKLVELMRYTRATHDDTVHTELWLSVESTYAFTNRGNEQFLRDKRLHDRQVFIKSCQQMNIITSKHAQQQKTIKKTLYSFSCWTCLDFSFIKKSIFQMIIKILNLRIFKIFQILLIAAWVLTWSWKT